MLNNGQSWLYFLDLVAGQDPQKWGYFETIFSKQVWIGVGLIDPLYFFNKSNSISINGGLDFGCKSSLNKAMFLFVSCVGLGQKSENKRE